MSDTNTALGPLELTDGRWVVGDSRRPEGSWVEFRAEGLYQHTPAPEGELIPWSRIMLGMGVTLGRGYPSRGNFTALGLLGGLPGLKGRGGGHLVMTLRHPYEDRRVYFDRHPRWYGISEIVILEELLGQTVAAGEVHRLADADWLRRVVARLAPPVPRTAGGIRKAVTQALQTQEPTVA
ncbi:hypothetical protein ABZ543_31955 [Streptomyces roseifaciens]